MKHPLSDDRPQIAAQNTLCIVTYGCGLLNMCTGMAPD